MAPRHPPGSATVMGVRKMLPILIQEWLLIEVNQPDNLKKNPFVKSNPSCPKIPYVLLHTDIGFLKR